jgi:hypothetical protein
VEALGPDSRTDPARLFTFLAGQVIANTALTIDALRGHGQITARLGRVFVAKMLSLARRDAMPRWVLPVLGGMVFASLIALWATSALWLFATWGAHS